MARKAENLEPVRHAVSALQALVLEKTAPFAGREASLRPLQDIAKAYESLAPGIIDTLGAAVKDKSIAEHTANTLSVLFREAAAAPVALRAFRALAAPLGRTKDRAVSKALADTLEGIERRRVRADLRDQTVDEYLSILRRNPAAETEALMLPVLNAIEWRGSSRPAIERKIAATLQSSARPDVALLGHALAHGLDSSVNSGFLGTGLIDASFIAMIMRGMDLPIPDQDSPYSRYDAREYMRGVGCRAVFLTRYGLVIKIMNSEMACEFEAARGCDLVLQPLKYVRLADGGAMAVLPGIRQFETGRNASRGWDFLNKETERLRFEFGDQQGANIGMLPAPWIVDGIAMNFPVALDHGCIRQKSDKRSLKSAFTAARYNGIQERIYGELKKKLLAAWPENELPDPAKMKDFFAECRAIVTLPDDDPRRILIPSWDTPEGRENGKTRSACRYEEAIRRHETRAAEVVSCRPVPAPAQSAHPS